MGRSGISKWVITFAGDVRTDAIFAALPDGWPTKDAMYS